MCVGGRRGRLTHCHGNLVEPADDVADGVKTRYVGLLVTVDRDLAGGRARDRELTRRYRCGETEERVHRVEFDCARAAAIAAAFAIELEFARAEPLHARGARRLARLAAITAVARQGSHPGREGAQETGVGADVG